MCIYAPVHSCTYTYMCIYAPIHSCAYTYMCIYAYTYWCVYGVHSTSICIGEGALSVIPFVSLAVLCCLFELGLWNAKQQQQPMFRVSLLVADSLPDHALLPLILN